jgi:hypothetical protein
VIIVGKSKILDKVTGTPRSYKYSDVPTDADKWVFDLTFRPIAYDLLYLKVKGAFRIKSGWWNGDLWEGLRLKPDDTILAWKRNFTINND